jgi:hypothetical protein
MNKNEKQLEQLLNAIDTSNQKIEQYSESIMIESAYGLLCLNALNAYYATGDLNIPVYAPEALKKYAQKKPSVN